MAMTVMKRSHDTRGTLPRGPYFFGGSIDKFLRDDLPRRAPPKNEKMERGKIAMGCMGRMEI